ncbi:MAG: serine protease [Acidimicrobiales bacterium]
MPVVGPPARPSVLGSAPRFGPATTADRPSLVAFHPDSVDRLDTGSFLPYVQRLERYNVGRAVPWALIAKVGFVLVVILAGVAFLSRYRTSDSEGAAFGSPGGPILNPSVLDMAQATVQLVGLDAEDRPVCSGSGTFVSGDGLILTNAHVVTADDVCNFVTVGVSVTTDPDRPPQLLYRAEVVADDPATDLAVLRVVAGIHPATVVPSSFPALTPGDSDQLTIGDTIRILGYPEIGGETVTFTNGSVSGFTAQAGLGDRAIIKTDATIAGGNSGGAAIDADGRLVGIPSKARASESGPAVDCRPLADTNGDDAVDASDNCVPIGGFLNGIRPINLAGPILERAREAPAPSGAAIDGLPDIDVDLSSVRMTQPRFSLGQIDNWPGKVVRAAVTGVPELCLFVDWAGIPNGAEWDAHWYRDGAHLPEYSLAAQRWEFGDEGANFWMCAIDDERGLTAGLYELGFFLDGELVFAEGITVADEQVPVFATTWENRTGGDVCGLAINPVGSGPVGLNELAVGQRIAPGESVVLELAAVASIAEAYDCEGRSVADSGGPIEIVADHTYTVAEPDAAAAADT